MDHSGHHGAHMDHHAGHDMMAHGHADHAAKDMDMGGGKLF